MLRSGVSRLSNALRANIFAVSNVSATQKCFAHHGSTETDEEFDNRYEAFFNRTDIDHWEARKAMNDLCGMDLVPDPKIIIAAMKACRRLNDYALAVRFLEACKDKCGNRQKEIYPYIIQECTPILCELGIETPEELGYDKPELALESVYEKFH